MYEHFSYSPPHASYIYSSVPYSAPPYSPQYATASSPRSSPRGHTRHATYAYATPRSAPLRPPPGFAYGNSFSSSYNSPGYSSDEHVPTRQANEETPTRAHARSNSHTTRQPPPKSPKPAKAKPVTHRAATEADCRHHDIPKGFSTKNWNPDEEPILLLGSVFDANSIGRWIYDWTAFAHNPHTPIPQIAAELWLLLIQTAGKMKMARDVMPKIRKEANREMVEDFIDSGERLLDDRFVKIVKKCEDYMLKKAKKSSKEKERVTLGKDSGVEFVECMFGRDRELFPTEKLINSLGLWNKRYDANCEDIVKHPSY